MLFGVACWVIVCPAHADQGLIPYVVALPRELEADSLIFGVFQLERADSNFFRLPSGVDPVGLGRRSVLTSTTGAGVNYDKTYGLQRILVGASVTYDHYAPYNDLDETSPRIDASYLWSITPSLSGKLSFDFARVPTDYEYSGFRTSSNPQTTRGTRLDVDLRPGAGLHPRLSIYENRNKTQDPTFQVESSRSSSVEGALIYEFRSTNTAEIYAARSKGANLNVEDDPVLLTSAGFKQSEYGLRASWLSGGVSTGSARVGYYKRTSNTFSQRDFSGLVGDASLRIGLTGKTRLEFTAGRALYDTEDTFSTYYVEKAATATLVWSVTGKIDVKPSYRIRKQDFRGSVFATTSSLKETTHYTGLEVDWAVLRSLDLALLVSRSTRDSNSDAFKFADNSASVLARFKF